MEVLFILIVVVLVVAVAFNLSCDTHTNTVGGSPHMPSFDKFDSYAESKQYVEDMNKKCQKL